MHDTCMCLHSLLYHVTNVVSLGALMITNIISMDAMASFSFLMMIKTYRSDQYYSFCSSIISFKNDMW